MILAFWTLISFMLPSLDMDSYPNSNKEKAFSILDNKCNVCHVKQNPDKVFSKANMDIYAKAINRQVFIWRRMPKGSDIKLNAEEKKLLKTWIQSVE